MSVVVPVDAEPDSPLRTTLGPDKALQHTDRVFDFDIVYVYAVFQGFEFGCDCGTNSEDLLHAHKGTDHENTGLDRSLSVEHAGGHNRPMFGERQR